MSAQTEREELVKRAGDLQVGSLVVASRAQELDFQRASINVDVAGAFRTEVQSFIGRRVAQAELIAYDPAHKPEGDQLLYVERSRHPKIDAVLAPMIDASVRKPFRAEKEFVDHMAMYGLRVQDKSATYGFIRTFSKSKDLSQSKKLSLVWSKDSFDRLTSRVFVFDGEFDCVATEKFLFVRNPTAFHRMFDYYVELEKQARTAIDTVISRISIKGADNFKEACLGHDMIAKAAGLSSRKYLDDLDFARLAKFVRAYKLPIEIEGSSLVFDNDPARRWEILRLLDDDHLRSDLTNLKYTANSKLGFE
jgi:Kiwa KwaB-like protein